MKEELLKEIKIKRSELEVLENKLKSITDSEEKNVRDRISKAERGQGDFKLDELVFSAGARCHCGAGLCYPKDIGVNGAWFCSDILLGRALIHENDVQHDRPMFFALYEIKSENQPSANGNTTRPDK